MKTKNFITFVKNGWLNVQYKKLDGTIRSLKLTASPYVIGTSELDYFHYQTREDRDDDIVRVYSDDHVGVISIYPANIVTSTFEPIIANADQIPEENESDEGYYVISTDDEYTSSFKHKTIEGAVDQYLNLVGPVDFEKPVELVVVKYVKTIVVKPRAGYIIEDKV